MGLVTKLLSFVRVVRNGANISDVKVDRGGGDIITPEHFSDPGDDSFPLLTDYPHIEMVRGKTRAVVTGYVDPKNEQKATSGEKRIYARDASGATVVDLWLKSDGSAVLQNANGTYTLAPDGAQSLVNAGGSLSLASNGAIAGTNSNGFFGLEAGGDFVANGAKIDTDGHFTDSTGRRFDTHDHPQGNDSAGNTQVDTGAPNL